MLKRLTRSLQAAVGRLRSETPRVAIKLDPPPGAAATREPDPPDSAVFAAIASAAPVGASETPAQAHNRHVKAARKGDPTSLAHFASLNARLREWGVAPELAQVRYESYGPMFRFVSLEELRTLLQESVVSSTFLGGGVGTFLTDRPDHFTAGRPEYAYRLQFDATDKFDAALQAEPGTAHTEVFELSEHRFKLHGGYTLDDVAQIVHVASGEVLQFHRPDVELT